MATLRLPVVLTPEDRLAVGAEMSAAQTALEAVKAEKKAATKDFNESIKGSEATIHDRNAILRAGVIHRDVEVETRADPETGKRVTWRLDTGVPVRSVDIDPDERQVLMDLPAPGATDIAPVDRADEQTAASPEEAEALRAERLAGERAERISAGVQQARERITVISNGEEGTAWTATLQYGDRVLEASAETAAAAADGVAQQVTEILQALEDAAVTMDDAVAASKAEQELQRLEAEQKADDAATKKRTLGGGLKNGGLKVPKGAKRKRHLTTLPDGREVDPEAEVAALDGEPPVPGDDGPVATGVSVDGYTPPEGAAF